MIWQFLQLMFILWLGATVLGILIHVIVAIVGVTATLTSDNTHNQHHDQNGDPI